MWALPLEEVGRKRNPGVEALMREKGIQGCAQLEAQGSKCSEGSMGRAQLIRSHAELCEFCCLSCLAFVMYTHV
jgi:hypothetical protein